MRAWTVTDLRMPLYDWRRTFRVEASTEFEAYRAAMAKAQTGPFDLKVTPVEEREETWPSLF